MCVCVCVLRTKNYRVNFKKNEKNYEANKSEVFKMVQEADKEPKDVESGNNVKEITTNRLQINIIIPIRYTV